MAEPELHRSRFEMTITRAEFLRLLPIAVGGESFRVQGDEIASDGRGMPWRIALADRPPLTLGPIPLTVLRVELTVEGEAEKARAFVERFLLGFQRAGG